VNPTDRVSIVFTNGKQGTVGEQDLRTVSVKERDEFV
jgi:hypothetical protein